MKWPAVADSLRQAFCVPYLQLSEGTVFVPADAFDLRETLAAAAETEEEREELNSEDPWEILWSVWPSKTLLSFEWQSGGPMVWSAALEALDVGTPHLFVCLFLDGLDEPQQIIAGLEPKWSPALLAAFVRSLFRENGAEYGVELFGSLPSRTFNHAPEFIPREVIKAQYWEWMDWASRTRLASWVDLRDEMIREASDPRPLVPLIELILAARRSFTEREREEAALTEEDRARIFENYFEQTYEEASEGAE